MLLYQSMEAFTSAFSEPRRTMASATSSLEVFFTCEGATLMGMEL